MCMCRGKQKGITVRAVVYARYSSNKQTEDSIEAQLRACREYATQHKITIVGEYKDEAVSGKQSKTVSRIGYQKLLRDSEKGIFDLILIHKYDRIARSILEHATLEKRLDEKGIGLVAVAQNFGNTKESKLLRTMMWSMSEYYVDNLSEEVKKGHREVALKGLHNGGVPPFGYDIVDQKYHINEFEAAYVRKIFQCAANREGFMEIIKEMEERGVRGKRGKPIKYTQIYEMLRNEKYTGTYIYSQQMEKQRNNRRLKPNAIRIENAIPAIIHPLLFEEVQKIMSERKQAGRRANYLCSGLVYCSCGAKMHGFISKRKGHEYPYYSCSKKCGAPVMHMEDIDMVATSYLKEILTPENQKKIALALRRYQSTVHSDIDSFNMVIKKEVEEKQKQYDAYINTLGSGMLPPEVIKDIGKKMGTLKSEIESLKETTPPRDFTSDQITQWLESLRTTPDQKAIQLLIEKIEVQNKTDIRVISTLMSVVGNNGRGDRI